jgi:hypothetical protein
VRSSGRPNGPHEFAGSRPILSLTAFRSRCLQPRYRSVVWTLTWPSRNWICSSSPPGFVTQTRACATKIVRSHILQTTFRTPGLHHTPDNLRAECTLPNSLGLVDCAKDGASIDLGGIQPIIYRRFDPAINGRVYRAVSGLHCRSRDSATQGRRRLG